MRRPCAGKGAPGTARSTLGRLRWAFVLGHDWVSLTPIFTEAITVLDSHNADIYFQCIYFDVGNNDKMISSVPVGVPGMPGTGRARKVQGHWLLSYAQVVSIPVPTLDVYD
jgi:hypothetical protein